MPLSQGTPPAYQLLAELCMAGSPAARPPFDRIERSLRQMAVNLEAGGLNPCKPFGCYERGVPALRTQTSL